MHLCSAMVFAGEIADFYHQQLKFGPGKKFVKETLWTLLNQKIILNTYMEIRVVFLVILTLAFSRLNLVRSKFSSK